MIKPELLDVIELLVNLPGTGQSIGSRGTIVECFDDGKFEVEFSDENGETTALTTLSSRQFIVVWKADTKSWLPVTERLTAVIERLSEDKRQQLFDFARFLHQTT
jgi:hypothetical protein